MAVKAREYLCAIDDFGKPIKYEDNKAILLLVVRLILLEPGSNPLHPEMGVGIKHYRYEMGTEDLVGEIRNQISQYLPDFNSVNVSASIDSEHKLTLNITLDDVIYELDVTDNNGVISLDDVRSGSV